MIPKLILCFGVYCLFDTVVNKQMDSVVLENKVLDCFPLRYKF